MRSVRFWCDSVVKLARQDAIWADGGTGKVMIPFDLESMDMEYIESNSGKQRPIE